MEHKAISCDKCQNEFGENDLAVSPISAFVVCRNCQEEEEQEQEHWDLYVIR